ncbi:MAG: hypothetical protein ACR2PG_27880 [Hyphomicrobiaceae bacterium]
MGFLLRTPTKIAIAVLFLFVVSLAVAGDENCPSGDIYSEELETGNEYRGASELMKVLAIGELGSLLLTTIAFACLCMPLRSRMPRWRRLL